MKIYKKKFYCIVFLSVFIMVFLNSEKRKSDDVFKKWINIQNVFEPIDFENVKLKLNKDFFIPLKSRYATTLNFLETYTSFFNILTEEQLENSFLKLKVPTDDLLQKRFNQLYDLFQGDIANFINFLKKDYFDIVNASLDIQINNDVFIDECRDLMLSLFVAKDFKETEKYLFFVANKLFDYCFRVKDYENFKNMLLNEKEHLVVKFLYSVIWWNLAGNGWKNWSSQSLNNLKKWADTGAEVVYIAGGSDIYQLIQSGIYNIRIIDPILPTQPKYYSEGWNFLIDGAIEDEIEFNLSNKIIMKRESFKQLGQKFKAKIVTQEIVDIEKSETMWQIYDSNKKKLGQLTIERRFVEQSDFVANKNKVLLISFNELYFICAPIIRGGWGINPYKLADNLFIYVKQLHKPISSKVARNIKNAFDQMEFNFIALGTCVN